MSVSELLSMNLGSPAVLAFLLGLVAVAVRSDLRFPEQITSFLSTFLLFAIGLKGGMKLRDAPFDELAGPALLTLAVGLIVPVVVFRLARGFLRFDVTDAASFAAHYGSVSAVTFTAAESFARAAGNSPAGFMPALVALLEVPGIIVALVIAGRLTGSVSSRSAVHEVLSGKSIVLLVGGMFIGALAHPTPLATIEPMFIGLFPGVLCLFLLDLGTLAGQRFADVRRAGWRLVVFAVALPLVFGSVTTVCAGLIGMSVGSASVLGAMAASASYIAAPAAVRVGLPDANLGLSLGAALGITFPFNLVIGIPLYGQIAGFMK